MKGRLTLALVVAAAVASVGAASGVAHTRVLGADLAGGGTYGRVGSWRFDVYRVSLSTALRHFGRPTSESNGHEADGGPYCLARWRRLRLEGKFSSFLGVPPPKGRDCDRPSGAPLVWLRTTGRGWRTPSGVRPGDTVGHARAAYRSARLHGRSLWLIHYRWAGTGSEVPLLEALRRAGFDGGWFSWILMYH